MRKKKQMWNFSEFFLKKKKKEAAKSISYCYFKVSLSFLNFLACSNTTQIWATTQIRVSISTCSSIVEFHNPNVQNQYKINPTTYADTRDDVCICINSLGVRWWWRDEREPSVGAPGGSAAACDGGRECGPESEDGGHPRHAWNNRRPRTACLSVPVRSRCPLCYGHHQRLPFRVCLLVFAASVSLSTYLRKFTLLFPFISILCPNFINSRIGF